MIAQGLPWIGMPQKLALLSMPGNDDFTPSRSLNWYRRSGAVQGRTVYYTDDKIGLECWKK